MSFTVEGEWGLRWRLNVALKAVGSFQQLAAIAGIPIGSLQKYLSDPKYNLTPSEAQSVIDVLQLYPSYREEGGQTATHRWYYIQWPLWTDGRLDALTLPADCEYYIWHYWATYPGAEDDPRSYGPFDPSGISPQESGREITNDNPAMLMECLVYVRTGV